MNQVLYILKVVFGIAIGLFVGIMCMYLSGILYTTIFEAKQAGAEQNLIPKTFLQILFVLVVYFVISFFSSYLATRISFGSFNIVAGLVALLIIGFAVPSMLSAKFHIALVIGCAAMACGGAYLGARVNQNIKKRILSYEQ
jgi:magnesium-transporting ATPase (P-type)